MTRRTAGAVIIGMLGLFGWINFLMVQTRPQTRPPAAPSIEALQISWMTKQTELNWEYSAKTYDCLSEMYTQEYEPIYAGPECHYSCTLLDAINTRATSAPAYIANPAQFMVEPTRICSSLKRREGRAGNKSR